jgi:hypothetical protein
MNLRYKKVGTNYIPQYEGKNGWVNFMVKNVWGELKELCVALSDLQYKDKGVWSSGFDIKNPSPDELIITFTTEMNVGAFLGAASYFYSNNIKNFN